MTPLRLAFVGIFCLLLFGLLVAFGQGFLYTDPIGTFYAVDKESERLSSNAAYMTVAITAIDHTTSMLITVGMALFVLVGFTTRRLFEDIKRLSWIHVATLTAFVGASFTSFFLGYAVRLQSIELVDAVKLDFRAAQGTLARQAFFVGLSAIFAVAVSAFSLMSGQPKLQRTGSKPEWPMRSPENTVVEPLSPETAVVPPSAEDATKAAEDVTKAKCVVLPKGGEREK